jgi:hypothetical protein
MTWQITLKAAGAAALLGVHYFRITPSEMRWHINGAKIHASS